jgi:flagellar basal body-associated protein FliL
MKLIKIFYLIVGKVGKKMKTSKKGNVQIVFLTLVIILILFLLSISYILYFQINSCIYGIKQDIFYIVQNLYLSLNSDELKMYNYVVDKAKMKEKVETLIKTNYDNVEIENLIYDEDNNYVILDIKITIKPVALSKKIGYLKLRLREKVKLKMMEVE